MWAIATSTRAKAFYVVTLVLFVAFGLLFLSVRWNGIVATLVYAFTFLFMLGLFPALIGLLGKATPASESIAKLHTAFGAFAYDHVYLVEFDDKYDLRPGEEARVYIDGKWHDIAGGLDNKSVLGWRPFGILRYKDDGTMADVRVDEQAQQHRTSADVTDPTATDGGEATVERGGYEEVAAPIQDGTDGNWVIDLKRVFSRGVRKFGDIELIETAEEIIERGQVDDGRLAGWGPIVSYLVSLVIGIVTGYLFFAM